MNVINRIEEKIRRVLMQTALQSAMITTPRPTLNFGLHLVDHCNLNCRYCNHFSPVLPKYILPLNEFERDVKRLAELFPQGISRMSLLGGEPLLHPQACDFPRIARKYFPGTKIYFITNGILLPKQNEEFWAACRDTNTIIETTKYPCNFDYSKAEDACIRNGVRFYFRDSGKKKKAMCRIPVDLDGSQDPVKSFLTCGKSNRCITLREGRLYTCTFAPYLNLFFEHFCQSTRPVTEFDSIDIYNAMSGQEIMEFLSKPIPACRYCASWLMERKLAWDKSDRTLEEWALKSSIPHELKTNNVKNDTGLQAVAVQQN